MKTRSVAAVAVLILGVAVPASSAMAFRSEAPAARVAPPSPYDDLTTGSLGFDAVPAPRSAWCAPSSASEGNANQQTRPVMQYGQTSGGPRC
ncbi:hypothetical protein AFCDBAGC_1023 [Methylobacterium cerastii]|uniref:Uncharacterized protein n=1 Tax=Methylobacterium cerastii TaxID=932741 RepID=A0ABQ4QE56_9HYPH|nr:hypothetical protein [Methylobacterium cerastii]GJD43177.1 hypothetical protein AFCDBAGC_1023 [Methylobacterium cerastii]